MLEIISNATPLIAFAKIGQLPLMQQIVGSLIVPEAVAEEISAYTSTDLGAIILAAESLQLKVSGSVGLLIKAKQAGKIAAVKPLLESMQKAGIYYSQPFIKAVLQYVGEISS